ncbi:MAG: DUF3526 domain-containing protein [Sediminibacterium sp.]
MFLFILKYECLSLKANRLLTLLAVITSLLFLFAFYDGYKRITFQHQTINEIQEQEKADFKKYRGQIASAKPGQHFDGGHFGDPTNPFYFGNRMGAKYAVLPPAPLSIIASGQSDIYPYYFKVTLSKKQALYHSEELENPRVLFNGRFDVSFVVIFLLPLLIIAFTYSVYSSEKENGTLLLLMAQNYSVKKIIAYRFVTRYLLFVCFVSVCLLAGLLCFSAHSFDSFRNVVTVFGSIWLYAAFWFSVAYFINSLQKSSGFAASALTGIWLLLLLIIPTVISSLIDMVHPMPSKLDLITKTRNVSDSIAQNKNIINRFLEEHPEFKPANTDPNDKNPIRLRSRIEVETAMEKEVADYVATAAKREATVNRYRFFSPAIFLQQILNKSAGTDDDRYKKFDKAVVSYQQQFRNYFEPLVYRQEKFTVTHLDGVPNFTIANEATSSINTKNIKTDFLWLIFLVVLTLFVAQFKKVANLH